MQKQGKSDTHIITQLQNEGVPPAEVNDAINQAKVKNAVSPPEQAKPQPSGQAPETGPSPAPAPGEHPPAFPTASPSVVSAPIEAFPQQPPQAAPQQPEIYPPQPPQQPQQDYSVPQPPQQPEPPQQDYYTPQPQGYSDQTQYPQSGNYEADIISEIAEQIATEKLDDYKSTVGDLASFKNQIQNRTNDIDDRLKRIENSIDRLQQAILGKIGEFGESSAMIHKDLDNLHGTIAKLMNPIIDNANRAKKKLPKK
jgi:hypothetical protein